MTTLTYPAPPTETVRPSRQSFGQTLGAEWIKLWTVRSTWWSVVAMLVLGAGLTTVVCAASAEWLASAEAQESAGSFITWGMMFAQIAAILLGTLVVTGEYGTGMVRSTFAATPRRGAVMAAKLTVLVATLSVAGTVTAVLGYLGGNYFLAAEGIGLSLEDEGVLRSLVGSGLYMAGLGLFAAAVGSLVRHTAGALSVVLALVFVVGNMTMLLPGAWGEWLTKLMPGNAGSGVATPVSFNPLLLDPWVGFAVFCGEVAVLLVAGYAVLQRRDA
ncbi:ABC transporter permease subunit [Ornithinicoccus halotolerans]|uniref:ABC transporter permease subunit n=1 Tax=Ornithinicoccus halotolerans TaxID=1748220 RepID=UPI0012980158|nr:ABC transporter permease subunit [Ornithinicoccus halotolerans]